MAVDQAGQDCAAAEVNYRGVLADEGFGARVGSDVNDTACGDGYRLRQRSVLIDGVNRCVLVDDLCRRSRGRRRKRSGCRKQAG
jgi:hypothetical protein